MQHSKKQNEINFDQVMEMNSCIGSTFGDYVSGFGVVGRS